MSIGTMSARIGGLRGAVQSGSMEILTTHVGANAFGAGDLLKTSALHERLSNRWRQQDAYPYALRAIDEP